ncbi:NADPH-Fe(3+) oxidoreductase subunit alpha [Desulfuromonas versatilis]|uniref:NADPH-Fe(3+) oxidoreductase subunit alpha n=1 Tax=Desulfuromonas versatilis TaxID=2802975 RepID=A0ABM8HRX4_9BACT|nr:molybdopterin-dependent oxidoreductase [Desulfuromonas versatilis]BCR03366.1 NADPH-Fe(3+) oxidoreductase subunit alpha [Desulfuromonas versatilis]
MVSLTIDGKTVSVPAGTTILEAARKIDIAIPTLCWLQKVSPTGACRICAVEITGVDRPMTACNTPVKDGIVVTTQSEKLSAIRRQLVEMVLVNHPLDCPVCDAGGECDLQNICYDLDVTSQPFEAEDVNHPTIDEWPLIQQVPSRCILCEKCVKVCHEAVGSSSLWLNDKGDRAFIDKHLELCEFCGSCVQVCPTGTMISKTFKFKARPWELRKTPSVCTYCGSQCQIDINVKNNQIYRVTSEDGVTVNDGQLCIGGFFGYGYVNSPKRLLRPSVRSAKGASVSEVGWDEALGTVAGKIRELCAAGGAGAIAGLGSARLTNEENYLFQKLFRAAIGSNNIDSEARFGALRALKTLDGALGLRGASNSMDRIGRAGAVLVFGSDVTAEAPAIDWQIEKACRKHDGKLVVANMRPVKLVRYAESFLNYRPGSEVALANALSRILLDKGLADEGFLARYLNNLDELKQHLQGIDLAEAAAATGLSLGNLEEAALYLGQADSVAVVFGGDITRSVGAEQKVLAIANLAMVCGALHGDVGGLFPVDEKGNMQGLLDMGVRPEALPGHQDYEAARGRFEQAWKVQLPKGGLDAQGILEGIEKGEIKLLYLAAVNPLVSFPESGRWRQALQKVDCLVVQDILASELTELADVVLPGTSFAEKSGSVTSLDQRVSCLGKALAPLGEAREDWDILTDLYNRVASRSRQLNPEAVLAEIKELAPLYSEVCFVGQGRCKPCLKEPFRLEEAALTYYPAQGGEAAGKGLELLAGKILFQFGTTSTAADGCLAVAPGGYIEMHPEDASACGVKEGDAVTLTSSVGSAKGAVRISQQTAKGLLFAPYHFADLNIQQIIPAGRNRVAVQVSKS